MQFLCLSQILLVNYLRDIVPQNNYFQLSQSQFFLKSEVVNFLNSVMWVL